MLAKSLSSNDPDPSGKRESWLVFATMMPGRFVSSAPAG